MPTVVKILTIPARPTTPKNATHVGEIRIQARAINRIFDRKSGNLVGWLYEWNTGSVVPRWKSEEHDDVYYD